MRINRIYWNEKIQNGQTVVFGDQLAHRLMHVLRVKVGYFINIFNASGEFKAQVSMQDRHTVTVKVLDSVDETVKESPLRLNLVQGISKTDKMDWVIQKAIELGVAEITPVISQHTQLKKKPEIFENKMRHWQKIIVHATEQCGRCVLAKLNPIIELREWLEANPGQQGIFLSPRGEISFDSYQFSPDERLNVIIGGEGGLSDEEETLLSRRGLGSLKLGGRVLRTETATVSALTLLQYFLGDLKL